MPIYLFYNIISQIHSRNGHTTKIADDTRFLSTSVQGSIELVIFESLRMVSIYGTLQWAEG